MEKKLAKRKMLRRKYKHYVAALAGAAIMAGVSLHGIPLSKVSAAENTATSSPSPVILGQGPIINQDPQASVVQIDPVADRQVKDKEKDKDGRQEQWNKRDHRNHRDHHHNRYHHRDRDRFERWSAFIHRMERYNERLDKIQITGNLMSPVEVVRSAAAEIGFDINRDTFTLLSQSGTQSIVTVIHNGNSYNVTVDQLADGNWRVSVVKPLQ